MSQPPTVKRLVSEFARRKPMRTNSLIVTVFGDAVSQHGHIIWLGSLVKAMELLGINERLVRTSVFRLVQEGWLESERVGRRSYYRFSEYGSHEYQRASRRIYALEERPWQGRWQLVIPLRVADENREKLRRSLYWQGFRNITAGTLAKPGVGGPALRETLEEFGLADQVLVMEANTSEISPARLVRDMVYDCWTLEEVARGYADFLKRYKPLLKWLKSKAEIAPDTAFIARTLLIHDYRRLLLRDTRLPDELLPSAWPGVEARNLTGSAYNCLAHSSAAYIVKELEGEDGPMPAADKGFRLRFDAAVG